MKKSFHLNQTLSVILAGAIQTLPLARALLPVAKQMIGAPPAWACVLRLATGAVALLGYHAVSKASSISISPANATVGVPYNGTVAYSGGHASSISGFRAHNVCLTATPIPLFSGLTIKYTGGTTAQISGTPTATGTFSDSFTVEDFNCAGGHPYTRSASLVVGTGSGAVAPTIVVPPTSVIAPIGTDVQISVAASGNPTPKYYWSRNAVFIPGATNSSLTFTSVNLTDAGLYSVIASNSAGSSVPATAWLTVCAPPSTNILSTNHLIYAYTNYVRVGQALTLVSYMTNNANATNTYKWQFNGGDVGFTNTFTISAAQATVAKSGTYAMVFNSILAGNTIVNLALYESEWAFGAPPVISAAPQPTNVAAGANPTFNASATVAASFYGTNTPLGFLWYKNTTNLIASQSFNSTNKSTSLTINNVGPANVGNYTVVVTNFWGSVTSSPAALSLATATTPTNILFSVSGSTLTLTWPASHLGWLLQSQTNTGNVGLRTNWYDWLGTEAVLGTNIPINPQNPAVFFRLRSP